MWRLGLMFYNERFPELHPPIIQKKIEQPIIVTEKIQQGSGKNGTES